MVVTRHENAAQLFNTKFRLNFKSTAPDPFYDNEMHYPTEMTIGRSSACNVILDYRTVSTMHAKISYERENGGSIGSFVLEVYFRPLFCSLLDTFILNAVLGLTFFKRVITLFTETSVVRTSWEPNYLAHGSNNNVFRCSRECNRWQWAITIWITRLYFLQQC